MAKVTHEFDLYGKHYVLETGELAKQATGACLVRQGDTTAIVTVVDGYVIRSDDNGVTAFSGAELDEYTPPSYKEPVPLWKVLLISLIVIVAALAILWAVLKYGMKWEKPFVELRRRITVYFFGENYSHNTKSKRKLHAVILIGAVAEGVLHLGCQSAVIVEM